ncbi:hypothetical protein OTU49_008639 [Cherax quadricarinatus]|uniref:Large ribosomal subunit protein mL42 n=1 Tax=Cherax quadricarinatus TaxID=27406 RepID=A0AAW0WNW9_CHEQU
MLVLRAGRALTTLLNTETRVHLSSYQQAWKARGREEAVVVTDDGNIVVCWHPELKVPYEMTKPLPEPPQDTDSLLKVQYSKEMKQLFQKKHPYFINKDLRELTFTTKHRWFPRGEKRFAKKNPPRDREYL